MVLDAIYAQWCSHYGIKLRPPSYPLKHNQYDSDSALSKSQDGRSPVGRSRTFSSAGSGYYYKPKDVRCRLSMSPSSVSSSDSLNLRKDGMVQRANSNAWASQNQRRPQNQHYRSSYAGEGARSQHVQVSWRGSDSDMGRRSRWSGYNKDFPLTHRGIVGRDIHVPHRKPIRNPSSAKANVIQEGGAETHQSSETLLLKGISQDVTHSNNSKNHGNHSGLSSKDSQHHENHCEVSITGSDGASCTEDDVFPLTEDRGPVQMAKKVIRESHV